MAVIYNFAANKAFHLLRNISQQVEEGRCEITDCQNCLEEVASKIEKNVASLKRTDEELKEHQRSCEHVISLTEECLQFIETSDIDELVKYRDRMVNVNGSKD